MIVIKARNCIEIPEFRCASSGMTHLGGDIVIPAKAGIYKVMVFIRLA